jgi:tetratricopeptide (TPR) repeat protein
MGDYDLAILNFDHAIAVDRHYLPAHLARAHALRLAGRTDEAKDVCMGLLLLGFESAALHHQLFNLFMDLGDEESAARALEVAQSIERQSGGAQTIWDEGQAGGSEAVAPAHVAALQGFHEAATPEEMRQLVTLYPFMADPSFISAAEQSVAQRQAMSEAPSRRQKTADAARLLWLRIYARL